LLKLACTLVSSASVSVQVGVVPVQPPLHPRKLLPACGVAVSVTLVPGASFAEQLPGQAMPPWLPVTEPEPVVLVARVKMLPPRPAPPPPPPPATGTNVAVTVVSPFTATVQVVAYILVAGVVKRGSDTISRQQRALRQQVSNLSSLLDQNAQLSARVAQAARRTTTLNEQVLRRIGSDLHDGPGQVLALALLRLDSLREQASGEGI
jgi:hypothetical protein